MTQRQNSSAASAPATSSQPTPDPRRWKALGVLALALALIVLDGSIVTIALPSIIGDLGLDISAAQWVNSLYSVVFCALLLPSGRLGDRLGRRTMLMIGVVVFAGASAWAGFATSGTLLIAARFVQGIGGAMIMPSTLSTVNATFRGRERAAAFGVWGAVMSGAAALGPLLGGWLSSSVSWRWVFYVNIPLGILVLIGAALWVADTRAAGGRRSARIPDLPGALLSGVSLALIVFGIIEGPDLGWFSRSESLRLFGADIDGPAGLSVVPVVLVVGIVLLAVFLLRERRLLRRDSEVLLDLALFRLPTFAWGSLTAATVAVGEFALLFTLPLYLVDVRGLSTMSAGLVMAALAIGAFISGALARHVAARFGAPRTVIIGLLLEVLGVVVLALVITPELPLAAMTLVLVVYGIGLGLASAQLTSTVLADVPVDESGQGSATQSTVRQLGTALGSSVAGALLASGLARASQGLSGAEAQAADALTDSAGSSLPVLRAQDAPGALISRMESLFTDGTQVAMAGAAVFLVLGLLGALQVSRAARRGSSR
jgi:EmrB/QacA subfamily drug resistance transporter